MTVAAIHQEPVPGPPTVSTAVRAEAVRRDVEPVRPMLLRTAVLDCGIQTPQEADRALDAFLQWFGAVPACPPGTQLVMPRGPVDRMWHAALLHTAFYRSLCERRLGFFLDHYPQPGLPPEAGIRDTVKLLVEQYGNQLSPLLRAWSPTTVHTALSGSRSELPTLGQLSS